MKTKSNGANAIVEAVNVGLAPEAREAIVAKVTTLLADQMVLYAKLRKFHWNVTGENFFQLHEAFEEAYTGLADLIDVTAEYIRQYGALAIGTLAEFAEHSQLKENPGVNPDSKAMVQEIVEDFETLCRFLRDSIDKIEKYGDPAAEDMFTQMLRDHQKSAWLFRAFVE
jgi:starvation-inducible DNA-binding protein